MYGRTHGSVKIPLANSAVDEKAAVGWSVSWTTYVCNRRWWSREPALYLASYIPRLLCGAIYSQTCRYERSLTTTSRDRKKNNYPPHTRERSRLLLNLFLSLRNEDANFRCGIDYSHSDASEVELKLIGLYFPIRTQTRCGTCCIFSNQLHGTHFQIVSAVSCLIMVPFERILWTQLQLSYSYLYRHNHMVPIFRQLHLIMFWCFNLNTCWNFFLDINSTVPSSVPFGHMSHLDTVTVLPSRYHLRYSVFFFWEMQLQLQFNYKLADFKCNLSRHCHIIATSNLIYN